MKMRLTVFLIISLCNLSVLAELPIDKVGQVKTLPQNYPDHWIIVSDIAFANMLDGKVIVLDAEEDSHRNQYKGMFGASSIASMTVARSRPEMYVYETYYSRGSRGVRTDVLTIYDKATLRPTGEIVIPGNKRAGGLPSDHMMHLIDNEKLLLLFNFTPAASISVIDIVNRKILNEINLPACSLIYPTGKRGFSSMCSDASMISYQLDNNGQVKNKTKTGSFFDIDKDALFERPAIIDGVAYFPTFNGNLREVDLRGINAVPGVSWSLVSEEERTKNWRPGGMQLSATDSLGNMYLLMHKDGAEGTHDNPGMEVWVFDVKNKKRINRISLQLPGLVLEASQDESPWLFVTNVEMNIDVYEAKTGRYIRTLSDHGQQNPFIMYSAN